MAKNVSRPIYLFFSLLVICGNPIHAQIRDVVQKTYSKEIGIRELTGHNDGVRVETYLRYCFLDKGQPWCASFVCWTYGQNKVVNPRSGFCPDLFKPKYVVYDRTKFQHPYTPQKGDVWGIYFPDKKRIAHVGFVEKWDDKYVTTVEGNTNQAGSREGDGVYRKQRLRSSLYQVASYIKP